MDLLYLEAKITITIIWTTGTAYPDATILGKWLICSNSRRTIYSQLVYVGFYTLVIHQHVQCIV